MFDRGNYDTFVSARTERLKNQQREYEAQKEYRDHIQVCFYKVDFLVQINLIETIESKDIFFYRYLLIDFVIMLIVLHKFKVNLS